MSPRHRFACWTFALAALLAAPELRALPSVPGDLDESGAARVRDVLLLSRHLAGTELLPPQLHPFADTNQDGAIGTPDVAALVDIALGFEAAQTRMDTSPLLDERGVALTREVIITFGIPVAQGITPTSAHVHAELADQPLPGRLQLSADRLRLTFFADAPYPPASRVRVTIEGEQLLDAFGRTIDVDGDGLAGGSAPLDFDTLAFDTLPGTSVFGRVLASEPGFMGGATVDVPLEGVTITVDGAEGTYRTTTNATGDFVLDPAPVGRFFVHIDGNTAIAGVPAGSYYPYVGKAWESVAGRSTPVGDIFLPRVPAGTLQPLNANGSTEIRMAESVRLAHPEYANVQLVVPEGSLYNDDGTPGAMVGIAPVAADRMPGPPPPGLEFPIVMTVQTDGATNFDEPVAACFPNLPDPSLGVPLAPGAVAHLWSFNHDTGNFEPAGPMTVSANGELICTDPGVGIPAPGWHGSGPPPVETPKPRPMFCAASPPQPADQIPNAKALDVGRLCQIGCESEYGSKEANALLIAENCIYVVAVLGGDDEDLVGCVLVEIGHAKEALTECIAECPACGSSPTLHRAVELDTADDVGAPVRRAIARVAPFALGGIEIPQEIRDALRADLDEADAAAGGDAEAFLTTVAMEADAAALEEYAQRSFDLPIGASRSVHYLALVARSSGRLELRGRTGPSGEVTLFIPRDGRLEAMLLHDPVEDSVGLAMPHMVAGWPSLLPQLLLTPIDEEEDDLDSDGLVDFAEAVHGTRVALADTDGDGVLDGAEIEQGTNALDGQPSVVGPISVIDTPGTAVDVAALDSLVAVADSNAGISVFNALNGMAPTLIARVDTPGDARRVSLAGRFIAVADGDAGLAVIDVNDPPAASIARRVELGAAVQAVVTASTLAWAGTSAGDVATVDLATGQVLSTIVLSEGVVDLALGGDLLYALTPTTLHALSYARGDLRITGSAASPFVAGRNMRLSVGGGIAYAVHGKGVNTFDLADPQHPALIHAANTTQFGWKHVALNGSGLMLAAVGDNQSFDGPHDVSLYDATDTSDTNRFLTTFVTPGVARAVGISNGLGYVADGESGMLVVNYRAQDALGVPPALALETSFAGDIAEEGSLVRVTANVTDDVQVRNVEFLVDGQRVLADGNFPFELRFTTPLLAAQASFTLAVRATDTGGNVTSLAPRTITLVEDATPPEIVAVSPRPGAVVVEEPPIQAVLSEAIDATSLTTSTFRVARAGPDAMAGTPDDLPVAGSVSFFAPTLVAVFTPDAALSSGLYRAIVAPPLRDVAGNALAGETAWTFRLVSDVDSDTDGLADDVEVFVFATDPDVADTDMDGIRDGLEDADMDGVSNEGEYVLDTDPLDADSDDDGILDGAEDRDEDGLADGAEITRGTDPERPDTDGDGWLDGAEVDLHADPLLSTSRPVPFQAATAPSIVVGPRGRVASPPVVIDRMP